MTKSQRLARRAQKPLTGSKTSTSLSKNVLQLQGIAPWRPQVQSPFLRCPAELRNIIYIYVLVSTAEERSLLRDLAEPALPATRRQIQAEALPIYFAGNKSRLRLKTRSGIDSKEASGSTRRVVKPYFSVFASAWMRAAGEYMMHILDVDIYFYTA